MRLPSHQCAHSPRSWLGPMDFPGSKTIPRVSSCTLACLLLSTPATTLLVLTRYVRGVGALTQYYALRLLAVRPISDQYWKYHGLYHRRTYIRQVRVVRPFRSRPRIIASARLCPPPWTGMKHIAERDGVGAGGVSNQGVGSRAGQGGGSKTSGRRPSW